MSAMAAAAPNIDDLVSAFASSHIGQHHIDIDAIRDQLKQLLYAQPQQAAAMLLQTNAAGSSSSAGEPRRRCSSLSSNACLDTDMSMDVDATQQQQQQQTAFAPPNSPQRMHPPEYPFGGHGGMHAAIHIQPPAGLPAEPVPPPSSPVQQTPFFERTQREPLNIVATF